MDKSLLTANGAGIHARPMAVESAKTLYWKLLAEPRSTWVLQRAGQFLDDQLCQADAFHCDMPSDPSKILPWMVERARETAAEYAQYQAERAQGKPRRYFRNKAHALYFLRTVAPTKLVDGAWLYGLLAHWQEHRFKALVRTYLEELGEGVPERNHVLIYKNLLAQQGCDDIETLEEDCYVQGATQLALGSLVGERLPEVIGYNLGYEQLPLHLLICTRELDELGIDPHYFRVHVTIDNISCGHARQAVKALQENLPLAAGREAFMAQVARGYRLNELGVGTLDAIRRFDLEQEVLAMLERKRRFAMNIHSDRSRLLGCPLNQWLSQGGQMHRLLSALQARGWIRRHEAPSASRFWQLIDGKGASMFGVFSPYEKQLIHDWIAGDWLDTLEGAHQAGRSPLPRMAPLCDEEGDFTRDERTLQRQLDAFDTDGRMVKLIALMSPAFHYRPAGLLATRLFTAQSR